MSKIIEDFVGISYSYQQRIILADQRWLKKCRKMEDIHRCVYSGNIQIDSQYICHQILFHCVKHLRKMVGLAYKYLYFLIFFSSSFWRGETSSLFRL